MRGALESIPELTKLSDSSEESKVGESKPSLQKPLKAKRHRKPRIIYSRENLGSLELPSIVDRRSSEERRKRLQELQDRIINKYTPKKNPSSIDYIHRRPPRPVILNNEIKRYVVHNAIKQAGLAVIDTPQRYIPIRPIKD